MYAQTQLSISKKLLYILAGTFLLLVALSIKGAPKAAAAACAAPATDYGTVTQTVNITTAQTYKLWSRMKASSADVNANSYSLEVTSGGVTDCYVVGDTTAVSQTNWTWVSTLSNNTAITKSLSGTVTVKMIGREAGVQLDRLLFLSPTDTCITATSTGNGDACTTTPPPVNQSPTVSITSPANNASFAAPASITINANAADSDGTVSKVEFFQGTTKLGEDLSSPYSFAWTNIAAGTYAITAKATDNVAAVTTSAAINVTVTGAPTNQADLIITGVTASPANPTPGQAVTFSVTVKNQGTAATTEGPGVLFLVNGGSPTWVAHTTSGVFAAGETRTLTANGGEGNISTWTPSAAGTYNVQAQVDDLGRIPESNDANNTFNTTVTVGSTSLSPADINANGTVNSQDITAFTISYAQALRGEPLTFQRVDVNGDGTVNSQDITAFTNAYRAALSL
jgi:hypothetical protein